MIASRVLLVVVVAGIVLGAPSREPPPLQLRWVDRAGVDRPCPPRRAEVRLPDRSRVTIFALFEDLAYAAADGGGEGAGVLLAMLAIPIALFGLWCRGFGCALRRLWTTLSLGVPLGVALLYMSCFLPGRGIVLGPDAGDMVLANLDTKTHYSTGFMSPSQLRDWHLAHDVRVLNVADRDRIEGAREAARFNLRKPADPPMTVLVGQEWRAYPDLVLVHVDRLWDLPDDQRAQVIEGVRGRGGAVFVAHPWSRMDGTTLSAVLAEGVDGAELVNGVINGGREVVDAALARDPPRALLGVTDPKFGPHLNAVTLIPARYAQSPRGVVEALRRGETEVLYAVPGGAVTSRERAANPLRSFGVIPALHSLGAAPFGRRVVWVVTIATMLGMWWISTHGARRARLPRRWARLLFFASGVILMGSPLMMSWELRAAVGPIPVPVLLMCVAPFAVTLLASAHNLALHQQQPTETPIDDPQRA